MNKNNELFIYMDDSGKLNSKESSCIFGGLFFYSSKEYNEFIVKYKSIINNIKCKYCKRKENNCNKDCIEVKGNMRLKNSHRRWIYNLEKKEKTFGVFIKNNKIYKEIIDNKSARGRYLDYAQKRIVKEIILYSIKNNNIDLQKPLNIYIKIDQSKTKSNGYYNLKESIYEELVNGIINYDYSIKHEPIIKNGLNINIRHFDSKHNYGIQSADMIANYLHRQYELMINQKVDISSSISFVEVKLFLP